MSAPEAFDQFAILEVVGHRRLGGRVREATIGGVPLLRIDVFREDGPPATQYYGSSAIFCLTLATEEAARLASRFQPPLDPYEVEMRIGAEQREQLREALEKSIEVIRAIEWSGFRSGTGRRCCPACKGVEGEAHLEGCALAAVIADDDIPF